MKLFVSVVVLIASMAGQAFALSGGTNVSVQNGTIALTGQVAVGNGGTGVATLTDRAVVIGRGTAAVEGAAPGNLGEVLRSTGATTNPAFGAVDLADTDAVTGTLPIVRGGTNGTSFTSGRCVRFDGTSLVSAAADCGTSLPPVLAFGSGMDLTTSQTVFLGPAGTVDTTEAVVQSPSPGATYANLRCVNSAIQGTANNVAVTGRVGACGSQTDGTLTCTITGTTGGNQACSDTTNSIAPTVGQCFDLKVVTPAALTASARIACVVERTA